MHIYYPSYNRWDKVHAIEFLDYGHIVVPESQEADYRKNYGDAVIAIPDDQDGWYTKKWNAVMDLAIKRNTPRYYQIDDDIDGCINTFTNEPFTGAEALELLEIQYNLAEEMGAYLWGFTNSGQYSAQTQLKPFSMNKLFDQVYGIDVRDGIRHIHDLRVFSNVDFGLQKLNQHRKTWRDNRHLWTEAYSKGGADSQIKKVKADRDNDMKVLYRRWGKDMFKYDDGYIKVKPKMLGI